MIRFVDFLPMLISCLFSYIIFNKIAKKYNFIKKVDSSLSIFNSYWKPVFYIACMLILSFIICVVGIFSDIIIYILTGIISGIMLNFINFTHKDETNVYEIHM